MQWINALTNCTDTTASATACFSEGHFGAVDGAVMELALVECVAQTVAAARGYRTQNGLSREPVGPLGAPPAIGDGGMLAAISNFRIQSRPLVGKPFQIETRELKRFGPMLLVSGAVLSEGEVIASGELTLYV